jgi:hypothetical protein
MLTIFISLRKRKRNSLNVGAWLCHTFRVMSVKTDVLDVLGYASLPWLNQALGGEEDGMDLKIEALPLVGEGHAYRRRGIATLGPTKPMPSGG